MTADALGACFARYASNASRAVIGRVVEGRVVWDRAALQATAGPRPVGANSPNIIGRRRRLVLRLKHIKALAAKEEAPAGEHRGPSPDAG